LRNSEAALLRSNSFYKVGTALGIKGSRNR
jgi:hypothetical protein